MVELAREACDGSLLGKRVAVLGAAFKPDSDDALDREAWTAAGWSYRALGRQAG